GLDVDVKTVMEDAVDIPARRTVSLLLPYLRKELRRRRVFVCSFDPGLLRAIHEEVPEAPTAWMPYVRNPADTAIPGALGTGCPIVAVDARALGVDGGGPHPGRRSLEYTVEIAHRAGLEIMSWRPEPVDAARYPAARVDAVVVDDVPGPVAARAPGAPCPGPGEPEHRATAGRVDEFAHDPVPSRGTSKLSDSPQEKLSGILMASHRRNGQQLVAHGPPSG